MKYIDNAVMWKKQDKNGRTYYSFKASRDIKEGETFNMFANDKNGVETRPDYRSYQKEEDAQVETEIL